MAKLIHKENVLNKVFTCYFSLKVEHFSQDQVCFFSFLFCDIFLFFVWIGLCTTSVQCIKTNIAITKMNCLSMKLSIDLQLPII